MITSEDRELVQGCLEQYLARIEKTLPAKEPPFAPDDEGVPPEMMDGEPDDEGWVRWKPLPSRVTEMEVFELEELAGTTLPPLFRAYLTTLHVLGMEEAGLPSLPSDDPLGELRRIVEEWSSLASCGYVAFVENADSGVGPLCLDVRNPLPDGDCPVVLFDHEELAELDEPALGDPAKVEPLARARYASFRELLQALR